MKKVIKCAKQCVKKFDLFSQAVSFRFNDQKQYQTFTGGCISLLLLITFIAIFTTSLIKTFNKEQVTYDTAQYEEANPTFFNTTLNDTFMFAVSFSHVNMNSGPRYFDIAMYKSHVDISEKVKIKEHITLKPCLFQDWDSIGFGNTYKSIGFDQWLCADKNLPIELMGKYTSDLFKYYKFTVSKCNQTLERTRRCHNQIQIKDFVKKNKTFEFNFYFVNNLLNPGDKQYIRNYLQDVNYFPFSTKAGVSANLFISSYKIQTDQSVYPQQNLKYDVGGVVTSVAQKSSFQVQDDEYVSFYIRKSPVDLVITRSFRRVDDTLSYIGGLFSAILACLGFVNLYNQFSYELQISKNLFYYDQNHPLDADIFNLCTYFIYLIYILFYKVGIKLPWQRCQTFDRFLVEGRKQMDMRLIMKKILYSQRVGLAILDKPKYKALHMQQPYTLDEAQLIRKDHRFYKNYRKKYFPNGEQLDKRGNKYSMSVNNQFRSNLSESNNHSLQKSGLLQQEQIQQFKLNQYQIHHEDEFHQLDQSMGQYILEMKAQADKGDIIAKRIYQKIDARVKARYIHFESQRK